MAWNIYRHAWNSEKDYENDAQQSETRRVATSDTNEHAWEIYRLLDEYENELHEALGRKEYEDRYGYVVFCIVEDGTE